MDRIPHGESIEIGLHPGTAEEWRRKEVLGLRPFVEQVKFEHDLVSWRSIGTKVYRATRKRQANLRGTN